jgi:hypothetical protein
MTPTKARKSTSDPAIIKQKPASTKRRIYRSVAIFFLAWTVLDLSIPQFCAADANSPQSYTESDRNLAASHASAPLPGPDNSPVERDDDCFCCCSHVLPSSFNRVEILTVLACMGDLPSATAPPISLTVPFHPPRV